MIKLIAMRLFLTVHKPPGPVQFYHGHQDLKINSDAYSIVRGDIIKLCVKDEGYINHLYTSFTWSYILYLDKLDDAIDLTEAILSKRAM